MRHEHERGPRPQSPSIAYRPDIDGLRAVAVLAVVAFHAMPDLLGGGFIGVDVFFVISGFLITGIILREKLAGNFSVTGFYARRIKRLFPALIVVLIVTAVAGWFYLLPHEFRTLGKHISAGSAYIINFVLANEAGYFDATAEHKPLLHLWSLAVEEQFYILWPFVLVLFKRVDRMFTVLLAMTLVSLTACIVFGERDSADTFYLPQFRIWELSLGSLLAIAGLHAGQRHKDRLQAWLGHVGLSVRAFADILSCLGLALILGAAWGYSDELVYPGAWALAPTLGALLIIAAGPDAIVNRYVLSWRIVIFIGLISYPLYLWHWPLLSFRAILEYAVGDGWVTAGLVAAAFFLACATYLVVERPLRGSRRAAVPVVLLGLTFSLCAAGMLIYFGKIDPRLHETQYQDIGAATDDWRFPQGLDTREGPDGVMVHAAGDGEQRKVLFIGDSHVQQYWPRIEKLLEQDQDGWTAVFATKGGCPPIPGVGIKGRSCERFGAQVFALAEDDNTRMVVIAANWRSYFRKRKMSVDGVRGRAEVGNLAWDRAFANLQFAIERLTAQGKTVLLVLNVPTSPALNPAESLIRLPSGETQFEPVQIDRAAFEAEYAPVKMKLLEVAAASGARIIDPMAMLCDDKVCRGQTAEGRYIYKDRGHLRASFVRDKAVFMDVVLQEATDSAD